MSASISASSPLDGLVFAMGSPLGLLRKLTGLGGAEKQGDTSPTLAFSKIAISRDYWTFVARLDVSHIRPTRPGVTITQVFAEVLDQKDHSIKSPKLFLGAPVGHLDRAAETKEIRPEPGSTTLVSEAQALAPGQTQNVTARLHIPDGKILLLRFGALYTQAGSTEVQQLLSPGLHVLGSPFEMWADQDTYSVPNGASFLNAPLELASADTFQSLKLTDIPGQPAG